MPEQRSVVRASVGATLVAALVAGCSSGRSRARPPPAPLFGQVLEWNMSGFSLYKGATTPVDRFVQEVSGRGVAVVAVVTEETCSAQFDGLREALAPMGFSAAANWSIPSFGQPNCASFGNAVFWRGQAAPDGVQRLTYPAAVQAQGAATQEQRNLLCVAFTVPATGGPDRRATALTPIRVCGTQLHRDPGVSARQATIALSTLDEDNRSGQPTFLLGDFNTEGDLSPRDRARPTTTGKFPVKYDYGFVPKSVDVPITADVIGAEPVRSRHLRPALRVPVMTYR